MEEITDSDASSLLSSLVTSKKSAHEGQIEFSNLSINPERVAKVARHKALLHLGPRLANFCQVVPERIFSVAFHPGDKLVAAAGDKWGKVMGKNKHITLFSNCNIQVGLWDCEDVEGATHGVHLFKYHSRPVNCLTWDKNSPSLFSTSYDGTVRRLDTQKQEASLVFHDENFLEEGGWTSFHCQDSPHTLLVSLGNAGAVAQVDTRIGTTAVSTVKLFDRLHAKSISCNPLKPQLLLAGNNKGGCFIFDLRSPQKSTGLMTPYLELEGASR